MNLTKKMFSIILLLFSFSSQAQYLGGGEANPNLRTNDKALQDFMDMRFGMFIHWGPIALRGTEIGWSRGADEIPFLTDQGEIIPIKASNVVTIEEYDNLYKEFNPVLFDAATWVKTAKDAGMKYLVITAKHHDGFCLWDSKYTEYDIMSTPFKKDILKELSEECQKQGVTFALYYSIADWNHPDYATRYGGDQRPLQDSNMSIYVQYMKNQLKELIDNYNPALIWFDGGWEDAWTHEMGMDLYAYLRTFKDDILINNRIDKGLNLGLPVRTKYAGDYETPEQRVGAFNLDTPWETCMTIGEQWAWRPNDKLKSSKESLRTLLKTVGGNGNLLYNVGPMLDGRIEQRQINLLKEIGDWLNVSGESVYATQAGPFMPTDYMVSTRKGNKIYLNLFSSPGNSLKLPFPKDVKVKNAYFLKNRETISVAQDKESITLSLNDSLPDSISSVLVLELDKPALTIKVQQRINY